MEAKKTTEHVGKGNEKKAQYVWHRGSIRVSGKSQVFKTGLSAFHEFKRGTRPVEFVFLGSNAGHQAFKAAVVALREIEVVTGMRVVCIPMWSTVLTDPLDGQPGIVKDVSIWRIVTVEDLQNGVKNQKLAIPVVDLPKEA